MSMKPVKLMFALMALIICAAMLSNSAGCSGGGDAGGGISGGGGSSTDSTVSASESAAATTTQITNCLNLNASNQAFRSGDWCQVNGIGFGSSKDGLSGSVVFSDSAISVPAILYYSWSDSVIVFRVPDGIPTVNVMMNVISLSGLSSDSVMIMVSATPNPSPQLTPPNASPTPAPTITPTSTPTATPTASPTPAPTATSESSFSLRSSEVENGGTLPVEFTGDGASATLPLEWSGAPEGTKSYAVIMHHIDPEGITKWYWILYNIPADVTSLPKNVTGVGTLGNNSVNGLTEYAPPMSSGPGEKTYIYTVYALSTELQLSVPPSEVSREVLLAAMQNYIVATAELQVVYTRF